MTNTEIKLAVYKLKSCIKHIEKVYNENAAHIAYNLTKPERSERDELAKTLFDVNYDVKSLFVK